ncbi:hypothetical protein FACS1894103_1950 [Campylobacterota bacterium]|nr:hypothetical protein FACS1894103_1950 [Campylobacterota bacterium]
MNDGFWTAISGAKTHQSAIDTAANNIANINTTGYRGSQFEFSSLFSRFYAVNAQTVSSDQGLGVRTGATTMDNRNGSYQQTDNLFDFAINDDGWFGVMANNTMDGQKVAYTRAGAFSRDQTGALVTQNGNYVLGTSFGNMAMIDGEWTILPDTQLNPITGVNEQTKLFIPQDLFYPPQATKTAALNANLLNDANAKTTAAPENTLLKNLWQTHIKSGETVLIAAGVSDRLTQNGDALSAAFTVPPNLDSPQQFVINGTAITAQWAAGATDDEKAAAVAEAINASGAATASANGAEITVSSNGKLTIDSVERDLFVPLYAEIAALDGTTTVADLLAAARENLNAIYPNAALTYRYDGAIALESNKTVNLKIASDNAALSDLFSAFTGGDKTSAVSSPLLLASRTVSQTVVAPNGDRLVLESQLNYNGSGYTADTELKQLGKATAANGTNHLIIGGNELKLKGGEELLFNFGKSAAKTDQGFGYTLTLKRDESDGVAPFVNFTLDGQEFSFTGTDGMDALALSAAISALLKAQGYESSQSGTNLIIYPKGDQMYFAGGTTNLPSVVFEPMSMGKVAYTAGQTLGDLATAVNVISSKLGVQSAFDDAKLTVSNSSAAQVGSQVFSTDNTPEDFYRAFSPLNAALASNGTAGSTKSTAAFEAYTVLSTASNTQVPIDGSAEITLNNNGVPLTYSLNLTANAANDPSAAIKADGVFKGNLDSYSTGDRGEIIANFDNGRQSKIAQLAVYQFVNDQGLMRIGDSMFMQSANSGAPFFYLDANGNFASLVSGQTLENSNVQSAAALTDLIIYQRAYEGNAKAITTNDQLIQNALGMKR